MAYTKVGFQDRAVQYPNRYDKSGETSTQVTLVANPGTVTQAGTPLNATNMNKLETQYDEAMKETELRDYKIVKSNKDINGIYTQVDYKRSDNTLAMRSVLSGGVSPQYTTRTITYYDTNGSTLLKTTTRSLSYDTDGDLLQEV